MAASASTDAVMGTVLVRGTWEYYEWGGWKETTAYISEYLEEQYLLGLETAEQYVRTTSEKCVWDFPEFLQYRKHFIHGQWVTVKTRSIRRIRVLDAPERPRG